MTATVLPFPAPPARAILQPSLHPRGGRPYIYPGCCDEWHAPGIKAARSGHTTSCAVDAAWAVERVLGPALRRVPYWPGVAGAREAALAFGAQAGLYPYQQEGAAFLAERDYAVLLDQMGCVEGDATIRANRAGRGFAVTLRDLYNQFNGLTGNWDQTIETRVRALVDGDLRLHPIRAVVSKGIRAVVKVTLASGKALRVTPDHEFAMADGTYTAAERLGINDTVLTNGQAVCKRCCEPDRVVTDSTKKYVGYCRKCIYRYLRHKPRYVNGKCVDQDGYVRVSGQFDHPRRNPANQVYEHILMMEAHLGRPLANKERVHHKNEIKHDNRIDNFELLSAGAHAALHGREGGFRRMQGGVGGKGGLVQFVPIVDQVVSILPDGETDVYDIVCADPYRNFVANGIIVHNCGKTPQAIIAAEARLSLAVVPSPATPVVLILCPAVVKRHWQREIKRWTGHDAEVLDGLRPDVLPATRYIICNYDILHGARRRTAAGVIYDAQHLPGWGPTLANRFLITIMDEVHILRGRSSQRSTAVRTVIQHVPVVWGLSGTIMPNYVRDLWAPVDIISGGLWGNYWPWARAHAGAKEGKYGWDDKGSDRLDELSARMSFFMLGRTKDTVGLQLPEKRREIFYVDVDAHAPKASSTPDYATRQKLVAGGLRATAKAKRPIVVEQVIDALDNKQRVIVGVYMREQCDAIAKAVKDAKPGIQLFCVHGDLSPDGRDAQATNFRQACEVGSPCAFICTIDSVGIGISLVGADLVLFGDLVPEPHKLLQFEARAHRHGSKCRVLVRYLIATGTIDEGIVNRVITKLDVIEKALGKELDQTDLTQMFGGKTDETVIDGLFEKLRQWGSRKKDEDGDNG